LRNRLPAALSATLLVALAFGGCSCEDPQASVAAPLGAVAPAHLAFDGVCNESLAHQTVTVRNDGAGVLSATAAIVGSGAAYFEVDPASFTLNGTGASQALTVTFKPAGEDQAGARHIAELEISYQGEKGTEVMRVDLTGDVSTRPVEPRVSFACGTNPDGSALPRCSENNSVPCCSVNSPDSNGATTLQAIGLGSPQVGATSSLPLRIENVGCGDLNVTSMQLTELSGRCDASSVKLVGADAPISVPGGLGAEEGHEFAIEFKPADACNVWGKLAIETDDPNRPSYQVIFTGSGRMPSIHVTDDHLHFGEVLAPDTKDLSFSIRNTGLVAVRLSGMTIEPAGSDFSIVSITKDACVDDGSGTRVPAGNPTPVDISGGYMIGPSEIPSNCGDDELLVTVRYAPGEPAGMDNATLKIIHDEGVNDVRLSGGATPLIEHEPSDLNIQFVDPVALGCENDACGLANSCDGACASAADCVGGEACLDGVCLSDQACVGKCEMSQKAIRFWNRGPAPLIISSVAFQAIEDGSIPVDPADGDRPLYSIVREDCTAEAVARDEFCTVTVGFKDKNTGGFSSVYLVAENNTPQQETYKVLLRSSTRIDKLPNPDVVKEPVNPRKGEWVRLDASGSSDEEGPITNYQWRFIGHSSTAIGLPRGDIDPANPNGTGCNVDSPASPGGAPANSCFHFPIPGSTRVLEFYAPEQGTYDFGLTVYDSACIPQSTFKNEPVTVSN